MSTKSSTCSNSKTTGCTNLVTERGNILCTECIEARKMVIKNRKDTEYDDMKAKITSLTRELAIAEEKIINNEKLAEEISSLRQTIKDKNILCEKLSQKLDATELELSHLKIDYQTLLLENERLANRQETSRQEQSPPPLARKPSVIKKLRGGKA